MGDNVAHDVHEDRRSFSNGRRAFPAMARMPASGDRSESFLRFLPDVPSKTGRQRGGSVRSGYVGGDAGESLVRGGESASDPAVDVDAVTGIIAIDWLMLAEAVGPLLPISD